MPEGLSPSEVGKEIAEHRHLAEEAEAEEKEKEKDRAQEPDEGSAGEARGRERLLTIVEATLLAVVAVLAAWSGFASAKWSTHSSLSLAKASAARTEANRADYEAANLRGFDSTMFDAWFTAYVAHNRAAMRVAEARFRPVYLAAFNAWLATHPFTNPNAPKGPSYMPQYVLPQATLANALDAKANSYYALGEQAGSNADGYVRTTVYLATVLFLVGISGHFKVRGARIGLIGIAGVILVYSVTALILAPKPPV
jgi:hypothetical protein